MDPSSEVVNVSSNSTVASESSLPNPDCSSCNFSSSTSPLHECDPQSNLSVDNPWIVPREKSTVTETPVLENTNSKLNSAPEKTIVKSKKVKLTISNPKIVKLKIKNPKGFYRWRGLDKGDNHLRLYKSKHFLDRGNHCGRIISSYTKDELIKVAWKIGVTNPEGFDTEECDFWEIPHDEVFEIFASGWSRVDKKTVANYIWNRLYDTDAIDMV